MPQLHPPRYWQYQIPAALTTLRLTLAPLMLFNALTLRSPRLFLIFLITAFLTDIFDGIIARRLGIVTPRLRRFDSLTDILFYLASFLAVGIVHPQILSQYWQPLAALLTLETIGQSISLLKFSHLAAAHAFTAKLWGIFLFIALCSVLGWGAAGNFFAIMLAIGFIAYIDWLAILILSRENAVDVPSALHAWQKRHQSEYSIHALSALSVENESCAPPGPS